jgi:putative ABC transport system ATP-binding protein
MSDIVIKDLIKVYKTGESEVIALRGLDGVFREGEIQAIMGPSGCGKTTLINILGGLDRPTAGSIMVDGKNLANLTEADLVAYRREKVGIVFQFFNLVPTLSAEENIGLPMRLADKPSSLVDKRVEELLKLIGLEKRRDHRPDELSGGEQQRIGIAVALANDPPILLADEPTGELDRETGQQILSLLRKLRDQYAKTIVIVTHDLRIGEIADHVMMMVDGRIASEASGPEFMKKEKALSDMQELKQTEVKDMG